MYILTPENKSFDTNKIAYNQNIDLNYCVLDYTTVEEADYIFPPMIFVEEFSKSCSELQIGKHIIHIPWDWCLLSGDAEIGDLEVIDIKKINGREFNAFAINPISSFRPEYLPIRILNFYNEIKWTMPVIRQEHMLCIPLYPGESPLCIFACDTKNKLPDVIDVKTII